MKKYAVSIVTADRRTVLRIVAAISHADARRIVEGLYKPLRVTSVTEIGGDIR